MIDSSIKCVIFDVDGTLLDSMKMWNSITFEYADEKGVCCPPDTSSKMNSMSLVQCAEYYIDILGVRGTVEQVAAEIVEMSCERYRTTVPEKPGAAEFVRKLHDSGVHIALATASDTAAIIPALERVGIWPYVEYTVTCKDLGTSKESPQIYLNCAEHFGLCPGDCMVAEDALYAARTAKNAGFRLLGVYEDIHSEEEIRELEKLSDHFIRDSWSELGI